MRSNNISISRDRLFKSFVYIWLKIHCIKPNIVGVQSDNGGGEGVDLLREVPVTDKYVLVGSVGWPPRHLRPPINVASCL